MARTALILIDIQEDYFPGGRMALHQPEPAAARAGVLLTAFRERDLPRIHIRHLAVRPGATFFLPGTRGIAIRPEVAPIGDEPVIQKHYPNAFRDTSLQDTLARWGIERLVIAGMMTHMCVDATTRAATDLGYSCTVAKDAVATRELAMDGVRVPATHVQAAFLAALDGSYGVVQNSADCISQLG
jgi:nicotinamidase-related amidase